MNIFMRHRKIGIALFIFVAGCVISFTAFYEPLEHKLYDMFLYLKPEPPKKSDVVIIAIDDTSIEEIGSWPWSRDIIANMLIRLRELGAKTLVFDIEYFNPSQLSINPDYIQTQLPQLYSTLENEVTTSISDFAQAIQQQTLPPSDANNVSVQILDYLQALMKTVHTSITDNVARNNDDYFAAALNFFGNAYLTINTSTIGEQGSSTEKENYAYEHHLFANVLDKNAYIKSEYEQRLKKEQGIYGITPALMIFLQNATGAGFPNVEIDSDGVRRRIPLLSEFKGRYTAQLVFAPILKMLDPSQIIREKQKLILKDARVSENTRNTIVIPLDNNGNMLINWIKDDFSNSFKVESAYKLHFVDIIEQQLIEHIKSIAQLGIRTSQGYLSYYDAAQYMLSEYENLQSYKQNLLDKKQTDFTAYYTARSSFFSDMSFLVSDGYDTEIYSLFEASRQARNSPDIFKTEQKNIEHLFVAFKNDYELYNTYITELSGQYANAFCVIGYSGTGTSDLGVTPFHKIYPNVGIHANIYNTIMTGSFIQTAPLAVSLALLFFMIVSMSLIFTYTSSIQRRILYSLVVILVSFTISLSCMIFASIYIQTLAFLLPSLLLLIIFSSSDYFVSEKEKTFIRKAFSTYLSDSVVKEIINDPSKLTLGGEEKTITALFTDIKGFSSFSEKMTAPELVSLLNIYLTEMSNIILECSGTIDKYIGDAIVAFFGAPIMLEDHAHRAIEVAIRMKQAEERLNVRLKESGKLIDPIFTRIGINTGQMVIGNMGTESKMNYTIMGSDVNLAARLEGVNKVYGSYILVSESTLLSAGEGFVSRKLDRIRVMGIQKPVEIFEIVGFLKEISPKTLQGVQLFEEALARYFEKAFEQALSLFEQIHAFIPDDYATTVFIDRCKKYINSGMPEDWDGVSTLTSK